MIKFEAPKQFADVFGNDDAKATLANFAAKRQPGSFLITGDPGTGKSALAQVMARRYACVGTPQTEEPCGACARCTDGPIGMLDALVKHYEFTDPKVRKAFATDISETLSVRGGAAFIIEDVDLLKQQETLLPILDSRPDQTFIFTTSQPVDKLDARFTSRCVQVETTPLSDEEAGKLATHLGLAVGETLSDVEVNSVVTAASGSGRRVVIELLGLLLAKA